MQSTGFDTHAYVHAHAHTQTRAYVHTHTQYSDIRSKWLKKGVLRKQNQAHTHRVNCVHVNIVTTKKSSILKSDTQRKVKILDRIKGKQTNEQ